MFRDDSKELKGNEISSTNDVHETIYLGLFYERTLEIYFHNQFFVILFHN